MTERTARFDSTEWERIRSVFERATVLPVGERERFASEELAGRPTLLRELLSLLQAHEELESPGSETAGFLASMDLAGVAALIEAGEAGEEQRTPAIGRYRTVRLLASGGMGDVYLAHDPLLDRPVALKLLPHYASADPLAHQRLLEEARAASALEHPHIGTVYEAGETGDGRLFLAMAFYDGETLRERLSRGPLEVADAVEIAMQVADGLGAAHERGIVHRDVKPENLVFGTRGVRILDFGIARSRAGSLTRTGQVLGTAAYMSPEQTAGGPIEARTDLWSLGVVLYEMLAGQRPFDGVPGDAIVYAIRNDEPEPLRQLRPEVPSALSAVVERCLQKDPASRYGSAAELRDALEASIARSRESAPRHRALSPASPHRDRRRRRTVAVGVGAAMLAGAVLGLTLWRDLPRVTAASGWAGDAFAERGRVLVADFQAEPGVEGVALATREALAVDLQQSSFLNVVPRAEISGILQRMGLADTASLDLPLALDVAERAGAGAVLSARVHRLGPHYVLSGRAVRPGTGDELFAVRTSAPPDRLLGAVEQLSREMRRRLGEERQEIRRSRPLPEVTTSSLQALRLYAEADRMLASQHDAAAGLLAEAIRSDSTFAMAHRMAAAIAYSQLRFGDSREHLANAFAHRERLTERERWHIEALYHASVTLEPRRAAEAYEILLQRYPDDWRAAYNLAGLYQGWLDEQEAAFTLFTRAAHLNPATLAASGLLQTAFLTGRTAALDTLLPRLEREGHAPAAARWRLAHAFATGDLPRSTALCDSLIAANPQRGGLSDDREMCGSIDVASGRLQQGIARLEQVERSYLEIGRHRSLAHAGQSIVQAHAYRGDHEAAADHLLLLMERMPAELIPEPDRFITRTNLQLQAALLGRTDLMDRIASTYPAFPDSTHWFGRAGDALVRASRYVHAGDGESALRVLRQGWPTDRDAIGWRIWNDLLRGMAFEMTDRPDSAAVHFRRAADPRLHTFTSLTKNRILLPLALQHLAAAEEARGDTAAAREVQEKMRKLSF